MDIVWFLLTGLLAGWLASLITKREGKGVVSYLILGVIGALLRGYLFHCCISLGDDRRVRT